MRTLLLVTFLLPLAAQTPDTATVQGRVLDQSHAAIEHARITLTNRNLNLMRTAETRSNGEFFMSGLPINGAYAILAAKDGFAEGRLEDITLAAGGTAQLTLQLNVSGGKTQVTVTGIAGEVRTDQPQLGIRLASADVQETPAAESAHHCFAAAERRQPPRHQPGRYFHEPVSVHHQRLRTPSSLV